MLTGCLTGEKVNKEIDETKKDLAKKFKNFDFPEMPLIEKKTDLEIDLIELPSPFPARNAALVDPETKKGYVAGQIYDAVKDKTLEEADKQITEKLSSNATLSRGQAWFFYVIGGALMIAAVVFFVIVKAPKTAIAFVLGAVSMFLVPTLIDAIHAALQGLIWLFWGCFGICFICIAVVAYRVLANKSPEDFVLPKKKPKKTVRLEQK